MASTPAWALPLHRRREDGRKLWFVLNHRPEVASVTLPVAGIDVLSGAAVAGAVALAPFDVAIVQAD